MPEVTEKLYQLAEAKPEIKDLFWLAGFPEGEGSFVKNATTERVEARQVNKAPLDLVQALLGGSVKLEPRTGNRSDIWVWNSFGPRARGVALTLYCLLSPKRQEQIRRMLTCKPT